MNKYSLQFLSSLLPSLAGSPVLNSLHFIKIYIWFLLLQGYEICRSLQSKISCSLFNNRALLAQGHRVGATDPSLGRQPVGPAIQALAQVKTGEDEGWLNDDEVGCSGTYSSCRTSWQSEHKQITYHRDPKHHLGLKTTNSVSPSGTKILHLFSPMEDEYFVTIMKFPLRKLHRSCLLLKKYILICICI